jgi:hypothetical protein
VGLLSLFPPIFSTIARTSPNKANALSMQVFQLMDEHATTALLAVPMRTATMKSAAMHMEQRQNTNIVPRLDLGAQGRCPWGFLR